MAIKQSAETNVGFDAPLSFQTRNFGLLTVMSGNYSNGALAIELIEKDGQSFTVLSVNLRERSHLLGEGEFFAKTWSENEEVAKDALASEIFSDTGRSSDCGVNAPIWKCI